MTPAVTLADWRADICVYGALVGDRLIVTTSRSVRAFISVDILIGFRVRQRPKRRRVLKKLGAESCGKLQIFNSEINMQNYKEVLF